MDKWNKTQVMKRRLGLIGTELYKGRPPTCRDSPIDGTVYLGQGQREAIVVDFKKDHKLRGLYERVKDESLENGVFKKGRILGAVYQAVKESMPRQDYEAVKEIIHKYGVQEDGKVLLGLFIREGVGVCRHDALACAALLERFKEEGIVKGRASLDRNSNYLGGHAWCRYTNSGGEVFILDVAQNFLGRLEESLNEDRWAYQRPEDY
jgi:hypothetical protein|tara:strand:- start:45 stop:665 length:621 start_codon:yes stop_codon:yes gene_type:complete